MCEGGMLGCVGVFVGVCVLGYVGVCEGVCVDGMQLTIESLL